MQLTSSVSPGVYTPYDVAGLLRNSRKAFFTTAVSSAEQLPTPVTMKVTSWGVVMGVHADVPSVFATYPLGHLQGQQEAARSSSSWLG